MEFMKKTYLRMRAVLYRIRFKFIKKSVIKFKVVDEKETINRIISNKDSISRIGEGELRWMVGESYNSFQVFDSKMKEKLLEVLNSNDEKLLVAISPVMADTKYIVDRKYWEFILGKEGKKWAKLLNLDRVYYNPNITRFYMEYKDRSFAEEMIMGLKRIWEKADLLIVEGRLTRFGVGNDFLNNASSVRRIIAPAVNAFSKYDELLNAIINFADNGPVIMALGPTASILAYDLSKRNIWAIDIGHADIEYEWFKLSAKEKIPIKGKYVNEAGGMSTFVEFDEADLEEYNKQIICDIH